MFQVTKRLYTPNINSEMVDYPNLLYDYLDAMPSLSYPVRRRPFGRYAQSLISRP